MAIQLNVTTKLAVPLFIKRLIREHTLVEESRRSSCRTDNLTRASKRTVGRDHGHVRSGKNVLTGAELKTAEICTVRFERRHVFLVEAVKAQVVVEQETRVIGKDIQHATTLKLNRLSRAILDPRFAQTERRANGHRSEVLIGRELIV